MIYKVDRLISFYNFNGLKHGAIPFSEIDFYHLTFVLSGKVTYKVNDEEVVLQENDALLLVPGTHRERFKSNEKAHYVIFNYLPTKGSEIASPLFLKNAVNQTVRKLLDSYPYTYYDPQVHLRSPNSENAKINEILPNLFNCILTELLSALNYKTNNVHVLNAIKYINDNITQPLSLNSISSAIHLSREHTTRIFKKEMGITVSEYVNQQKTMLAKDMLTSDEFSLQDIAYSLGYENYGYFNHIFKKNFGITPIKMRKKLKNK